MRGGRVTMERETGTRTNRGNMIISFIRNVTTAIGIRFVLRVVSLLLLCGNSLSCPCRCWPVSEGMYVNCSHNNSLRSVPDNLPVNTAWLDFSYTHLTEVKNDTFVNLSSLIYLDLYNAKLYNLEPRAFAGLSNLRHLNISANDQLPQTDIRTPELLFKDLTSLIELKMFGTTTLGAPGTYPDKALSYLTNLTHLYMDGIQGHYPGPGFLSLKSLIFISISGDNVQLGSRFCHTNLYNNTFDNVPHITHLEMRACDITKIENQTFNKLPNLTYLDLSLNINLHFDPIANAMDSLAKTKLTVLKINHVYDTKSFSDSPMLTEIQCKQIHKLKNLEELHIESNGMVGVKKHGLKHLPESLVKIFASGNEFEIHYYVFELRHLKNVTYLDVSYQFFSRVLWEKGHDNAGNTVSSSPNGEIGHSAWPFLNAESFIRDKSELNSQKGVEKYATQYLLMEDSEDMTETEKTCAETPKNTRCPNVAEGHIPGGLLQPYIPPNMEKLDISHCKLAVPLLNMTFAGNNALTEINAQMSLLFCWAGPVSGIEGLKKLNLSNNLCTSVSNHFFDSFPKLQSLDVSNNMIGPDIKKDTSGCIFKNMKDLTYINLADNQMTKIPRKLFRAQKNLVHIILAHNLLKSFDLAIKHMVFLSSIDLRCNFISTLSERMRTALEDVAERTARHTQNHSLIVDLADNFIFCNCQNMDFLEWVSHHQSGHLKISITSCMFENQTVIKFKDPRVIFDVILDLRRQCRSYTTLIGILIACLTVFFNVIVAALVYRFRWKLRYWYYRRGRSHFRRRVGNVLESMFSYDAFIVSPDDYEQFIEEKLMPNLERKRKMRLLIEFRNSGFFRAGGNIYHQYVRGVESSRSSIFLVTRDNAENKGWELAFRMAEEESLSRGYTVYFVIILEDVAHIHLTPYIDLKLKEIYKSGLYVEFPMEGSPDEEEHFYDECMARIRNSENAQPRRVIDVTLSR